MAARDVISRLDGCQIYLQYVQGNITAWKKKEGQEIAAGDVLCEIETDKVGMAVNTS